MVLNITVFEFCATSSKENSFYLCIYNLIGHNSKRQKGGKKEKRKARRKERRKEKRKETQCSSFILTLANTYECQINAKFNNIIDKCIYTYVCMYTYECIYACIHTCMCVYTIL